MKKRLYIISVITVFLICFLIMVKRVKVISDKYYSENTEMENVIHEETTTKYIHFYDIYDELPEYDAGYIKDLEKKFAWSSSLFPKVKDYDPNNKVAKNGCYGLTSHEVNHRGLVYKKVYFYDKENKLPTELQGKGKYNKENVYEEGENFELKSECLNGEVKNIQLHNDILGFDEKYFFDINLVNESLNNNMVFVTADIELRSTGNWITESDIVPGLIYLYDNGEYLKVIEDENNNATDQEITDKEVTEKIRPVYYDLGFYDLDTEENCFLYPMRKGESVSFKVGYFVDRDKVDNAYIYYRADASEGINNSYNNICDVLVKLKG